MVTTDDKGRDRVIYTDDEGRFRVIRVDTPRLGRAVHVAVVVLVGLASSTLVLVGCWWLRRVLGGKVLAIVLLAVAGLVLGSGCVQVDQPDPQLVNAGLGGDAGDLPDLQQLCDPLWGPFTVETDAPEYQFLDVPAAGQLYWQQGGGCVPSSAGPYYPQCKPGLRCIPPATRPDGGRWCVWTCVL